MKSAVVTLLIFIAGVVTAFAQTPYLDQIPTTETGIVGEVLYKNLSLRIKNIDDTSHSLKKGTRFVLLNEYMIREEELGVYLIKIRVLENGEDATSYNKEGLVGYVYVSLTSLAGYINYEKGALQNVPLTPKDSLGK